MLHRQGRLPLDDTLDPRDPILQPRRRPRRQPPTVYVHREPIPHQPALSLALCAVAIGGYVAWGAVEWGEGAVAFPVDLVRGRRATAPEVGLTSASFALTGLLSATVGRRPGRSRALRRAAIVAAGATSAVVTATVVAGSLPLVPT